MRTARHRIPLAIALLAGSAVAFGQTTAQEHAAHHPDQQTAAAGAATDAAKAPPGGTTQESIKEMHDRAAKMHKLMEQIQRTKDPTERARLLKEHRQVMLEQARSMQHMGCSMEMSESPQGETGPHRQMDKPGSTRTPEHAAAGGMMSEMMPCHQLTQARMDMVAEMLQEMLEHEKAER
jgi:hypothetical protein